MAYFCLSKSVPLANGVKLVIVMGFVSTFEQCVINLSLCPIHILLGFLQIASAMEWDPIAQAVMMKENVVARRLILLGTSVINVIRNPISFQNVEVGLTVNIVP